MSLVRHFVCLLASLLVVSCGHNVDLKYPTVQQADDMDVNWGLERRKTRGGPKQFFQSRSTATAASGFNEGVPAVPAAAGPAPTAPIPPAPVPAQAAPATQPSVNVPASLR